MNSLQKEIQAKNETIDFLRRELCRYKKNEKELIDINLSRILELKEAFSQDYEFNSLTSIYYTFPALNPQWLMCCVDLGILIRTGTHRNYNYSLSNKKINKEIAKEVYYLYYEKQKKGRLNK